MVTTLRVVRDCEVLVYNSLGLAVFLVGEAWIAGLCFVAAAGAGSTGWCLWLADWQSGPS